MQNLTEDEKQRQREDFERREREYTRFQRTRMTAADFEPLTVIGRGAFGEVQPKEPQESPSQELTCKHTTTLAGHAGETVQGEGNWSGCGSEEAAEVRDASKGAGELNLSCPVKCSVRHIA